MQPLKAANKVLKTWHKNNVSILHNILEELYLYACLTKLWKQSIIGASVIVSFMTVATFEPQNKMLTKNVRDQTQVI